MASTEFDAVQSLDGRKSRTARSRRLICEACLDLVQEGSLQPSADQVAERAGVSRRSIFNHFSDLGELYDAVVEVGMQRYFSLQEEISGDEPIARRVEQITEVRGRFLEATSAFTRALTAQSLVGPASDHAMRVSKKAVRVQHREVERLFQADLSGLFPAEQNEVLEAMSAAMSPLLWEYLRRTRGYSAARARALVARMLGAILRDAGVDA
jgi:TetR/AcrR family transcriptional regulator, regulator of autoinduction and epiphytic fitness